MRVYELRHLKVQLECYRAVTPKLAVYSELSVHKDYTSSTIVKNTDEPLYVGLYTVCVSGGVGGLRNRGCGGRY